MSLAEILDISKIGPGLSPKANIFPPGLYSCFGIIDYIRSISQVAPDIMQALRPTTGSVARNVQ